MVRRAYVIALALIMALIGFVISPAGAQTGRTFYIDYDSGSNSNPGTNASPWKTHPYMQADPACTGTGSAASYVHQAGDQFIFKGGVTWPASCFGMAMVAGGSASVNDYYGVDKSWFSGSSWTRPIFDMANAVPTGGGAFITTARYVTIDNLELARLSITAYTAECANANINATAGNVTVENSYIHDWTITPGFSSTSTAASTNHGMGSICQSGAPGPVNAYNNVISDKNTTAAAHFGACFRNLTNVEGNDCEYTAEGEVGHFGNTDNNIFANMDGTTVEGLEGAHPNHTNVLHMSDTAAGDGPIFNNLIHDNQSGVDIFTCAATDVYNNVIYNNRNAQIMYSTSTNDCPGVNTSTVGNVYNNTVDCSNGWYCFRSVQRTSGNVASIFNIRNNVFITNGTDLCINNTGGGCANISAGSAVDHNYKMSTSEASTYGFTGTTKYAPTSSDSHVTSAGANMSGACSAQLADLCEDVQGTAWYGGSYQTRPLDTTAWTIGAYVFGGQSQASKPNPPTNLTASVQ
ncbi:MAG TPA: hypothetical protein VGR97_12520 [Candidatus Acidoferrales bacterium]|nr:hypothetical protein [Candidatus Acidoferrales bacterium]